MSNKLNHNSVMKAMDWAYDKAVNGFTGVDSAIEMAADYMKGDGSLYEKANSLIRWQNCKAGTSGFITGLGGFISMPVSIPANISSVLYVQVRMIAAIACMGGYNLNDDRVKTMVFVCMAGNTAKDILKEAGVHIGSIMMTQAIKNIPGKMLIEINKKVGFRLITKLGEKGIINLIKWVPAVGGVIGATCDSLSTNVVGNVARNTFIKK